MLYQQGDILIEAVEKFPKGIQKHDNILAEGEATGHAHTVDLSNSNVYCDEAGNLYLEVIGDNVVVKHEEHKQITVPKGKYMVRKVREFDHFKNEPRPIRD